MLTGLERQGHLRDTARERNMPRIGGEWAAGRRHRVIDQQGKMRTGAMFAGGVQSGAVTDHRRALVAAVEPGIVGGLCGRGEGNSAILGGTVRRLPNITDPYQKLALDNRTINRHHQGWTMMLGFLRGKRPRRQEQQDERREQQSATHEKPLTL